MAETKISTMSAEFFPEMLRTLPIGPSRVPNLYFTAQGIPYYGYHIDKRWMNAIEAIEEYMRECRENGFTPFCVAEFNYNDRTRQFSSRGIETRSPSGIDLGERVLSINTDLIIGAKPYSIKFEIDSPAEDGFRLFREQYLEMLIGNGYDPNLEEIWIRDRSSIWRASGDSRYLTCGLTLIMDERTDLREATLETRARYKEEQTVNDWFEALRRKYN